MAFRRLTFIIFIFISQYLYGVSSVSELFVTPKSIIPKRGIVNYGIEYLYDSRQNFFYRFSLSDSFQVGMNATEDFDVLMGMHATLFEFDAFSARHYFGLGAKNLGWNLSVNKYNIPVIRKYGVYSIRLPNQKSNYHFGFSEYRSTEDYYFTAGATYFFKRFTTMTEWDGKQVHVSIKYYLKDDYDVFIAITPAPYQGANVTELNNLSISLIRKNIFFNQRDQIDELTKKYKSLKSYVDVLDAKLEVVKEFNSTDFLEEFQQFLLQEHMVEKELMQEKKSAIRSALDHMQRGLEFYYKGQYELALQEYRLVINLIPKFSMGYARLGSIYYKLDDLKNAKLNWEKALELDPTNQSLKVFLKRVTPIDFDSIEDSEVEIESDNLLDIIPSKERT